MAGHVSMKERMGGMSITGSGGGGGKGGGGSARTPREEPDSLHNVSYAAVLDVIANGEVAGPAHPYAPLRDIYLDGTPIQNSDGSLNFRNVQVEYRHGTQNQEHIPGFPAASSVTGVGVEVSASTPWTQQLTNPDLSAARVTLFMPQLMRLIDSGDNAGDRVGYRVVYAIDVATGSGSYVEAVLSAMDGKTVNGYARTHRVELPPSSDGWRIRVRRLTPDSTSSSISDTLIVQSYAEVIDGKFRYPMTALVGIKIDAEQFQAVPTRAYHWRGSIIRVPSNYDPETRTYTGVWDGTFKRAYSNNPAWVFYDILMSPLYGLGERIDASMVDRYALYQIGAYCDQMVSDGQGGTEPRFTCNVYIQGQNDALRVIQDLASVFRGMAYWANGQVFAVADTPSDPVYTYTNANVIDGVFEYTGADITTRKTVALVSWNDLSDFGRSKVEVVNDDDGIRRYGIRQTELVAFGCTSRAQAQRVGLYALYTSRMETGGVAFSVGLDGVIPQPGSIIRVADQFRQGRQLGGRITSATADSITADRDPPASVGDILSVNLPSGVSQQRSITAVNGRTITVSPPFDETPSRDAVWSVDASDLVAQQFRVVSVAEGDGITFNIAAVAHHPGKYAAIDNGVRLEPLPVSVVPPRVQTEPDNIEITQHHVFHQGTTRHYAEISWDEAPNAVAYDVQWRRDNGDWVIIPRTGVRLVQIPDIYSGEYIARVRAINSLEVPSLWAYSQQTTLDGLIGEPPTVTHLTTIGEVMAITLDWGYPNALNIIERAEIRASLTNSFSDSFELTNVAYPDTSYTMYGLAYSTELWFWIRLVDKNGTAGMWFPDESGAGIFGQPTQNPEELLDYLEGRIGEGQLAQDLLEEIELISGDGPGSVNERIGDAKDSLGQQISALEAQLAEIIGAPDYDPTESYLEGALVKFDGSLYRAIQDVPAGTPVTDESYWQKVGDYDSIGELVSALAVRMTAAEVNIDTLTGEVTSQGQQISAIDSRVTSAESGISGNAQAISEIQTEVTELDGRVESTVTSLDTLRATIRPERHDGEKADSLRGWYSQALFAEQVTAQVSDDEASVERDQLLQAGIEDTNAALLVEQQVRASADAALAQQVTSLGSRVDNAEGDLSGFSEALDLLETEVTDYGDRIEANATSINTLSATIRPERHDGEKADSLRGWYSQATFAEQVTVQATADEASVERDQLLSAEVDATNALILIEQQVRASADAALAQQQQTLQAAINNTDAIVQQTSQALAQLDGALSASWQVKTQVRSDGRVVQAGVGLGASIDPDGTSRSEILLMADTIAFLTKLDGQLHAPFIFDVASDTAFLNSVFIQNGTITNAKIANATIGSAKFQDWLESDTLGPGGVPVLRLNFRTGQIQMNSPISGGGRMTLTNERIEVFDASNNIRVRLGRLI